MKRKDAVEQPEVERITRRLIEKLSSRDARPADKELATALRRNLGEAEVKTVRKRAVRP
ncbi:MAG TPA: hypothetical protein VI759_05850 [Dehalococcoidia bacterium]|nr:hypothetical protein [Dehalococcoidia bacterium]